MNATRNIKTLLHQVCAERGGKLLQHDMQSLGFDLVTKPRIESKLTFPSYTFPRVKLAEIAASKITWIKGGAVTREAQGKRIIVTLGMHTE